MTNNAVIQKATVTVCDLPLAVVDEVVKTQWLTLCVLNSNPDLKLFLF